MQRIKCKEIEKKKLISSKFKIFQFIIDSFFLFLLKFSINNKVIHIYFRLLEYEFELNIKNIDHST